MNVVRNRNIISVVISALLLVSSLYGQNNDANDEDKFSSLSFSLDFMTDHDINGRLNTFKSQPTFSGMIAYYHKSGFDLSTTYSNIWNSDESTLNATQSYDLSIGYIKDLNKWLSMSAMYSHFFYSKNAHSQRSGYNNLFSAGLYSQVNWWIADVMAGYYSGKSDELFFILETGGSLEFDNVFKKGNNLSIQLSVSAYMGDISYYNIDAYSTLAFAYEYSKNNPDVTIGDLLESTQRRLDRLDQNNTTGQKTYKERVLEGRLNKLNELPYNLLLADMYKEQQTFNFNNLGFEIPIYYYWNNFMISVGFSAFYPVNQPSYLKKEWSSYSNIGLTYFMTW